MVADKLLEVCSDPLWATWCSYFGRPPSAAPESLLRYLGACFAAIPYENLTKIVAYRQTSSEPARSDPAAVLRGYAQRGTGGTCFALTAVLVALLRRTGLEAWPILADRPYGPDTHCALVTHFQGRWYLLDPGYLVTEPVPLPVSAPTVLQRPFNMLELVPVGGQDRLRLSTVHQGQRSYRLEYKLQAVDESTFSAAWDRSYTWDMMHYPVVSVVRAGAHYYLQGNRLQIRTRQECRRIEVPSEQLPQVIAQHFGIATQVAGQALHALEKGGRLVWPTACHRTP